MNTKHFLSQFNIDANRGFLPAIDPIKELPKDFIVWEECTQVMQDLILEQKVQDFVDKIPLISNVQTLSKPALERANLILSFIGHAYVYSGKTSKSIPEQIAIPWVITANKLGRLPILSHGSLVLQNWELIENSKPLCVDNLKTKIQFNSIIDESWFYLVTVDIERAGGPAIKHILETLNLCKYNKFDEASTYLRLVYQALKDMNAVLKRMYEKCQPERFYRNVRPFLASFEDIEYQGCTPLRRSYHGGSAAQSSLLQFFDIAFGIRYDKVPSTNQYLKLMRKHMPNEHAKFLIHMESKPSIESYSLRDEEIKHLVLACKNELTKFRDEHLKMVAIYITKEARKMQQQAVGTGGTNPLRFLKEVRDVGSNETS